MAAEDGSAHDDGDDVEEARPLLRDVEVAARAHAAQRLCWKAAMHDFDAGFSRACWRSVDIFKGVLVIFMTFAHVNLTLMSPALQLYSPVAHLIGNVAAGQCFLGFMLAYGFACDGAYFANRKPRGPGEAFLRVARSCMLPIVGAWVCMFAWGFMCFKLPMDGPTLLAMLTFRLAVGNGPDFLMCFPVCLLVMFALRHIMNRELSSSSLWRRYLCAAVMLLAPLCLTQFVINDCTGLRKYYNYFFECNARELWSPNLPALPHLFYFNLGVLLSRAAEAYRSWAKGGGRLEAQVVVPAYIAATMLLALLSYPLLTVWVFNYGNLAVATPWGNVIRGFSGGPSPLWLLGNLFGVEVVLSLAVALHLFSERADDSTLSGSAVRAFVSELEHLGANILLYLVVADVCLSGLWRGSAGQYPLGLHGGAVATFGILAGARFLFYLARSGHTTGAAGSPSKGAAFAR
mmetsp:Transcript_24248/g.68765  ORF Transcript_24248/g.68765 Transcript_24248/m.68765 type:complete len:460 (-) Transcript_24248:82-1461(-)